MSVTVVAELSINHGGNVDTAYEMIRAAKDCGCDGVKVQAYDVRDFLPEGHEDWEMFAGAQLTEDQIEMLCRYTHDLGLLFGATPTNLSTVWALKEMGVDFLKNGSDFLLRTDLIEAMLATGLPTWVSTGMATRSEINLIRPRAKKMLCTSIYPCPDTDMNLARLRDYDLIWRDSPLFDGLSDHSTHGSVAAVMAVALGVEMIERHFMIEGMDGFCPDGEWSLGEDEMRAYVRDIRRAEEMIGESVYPTPGEVANRDRWRVTKETLRS